MDKNMFTQDVPTTENPRCSKVTSVTRHRPDRDEGGGRCGVMSIANLHCSKVTSLTRHHPGRDERGAGAGVTSLTLHHFGVSDLYETFWEEVQPDRMGYSRNLLHKYFISGKITLILRQPPDLVSYEVKNLGFTS